MSKTEHFPLKHWEIKYNNQLSDYRWSRQIGWFTRTSTAGQFTTTCTMNLWQLIYNYTYALLDRTLLQCVKNSYTYKYKCFKYKTS